MSYQEQIVQLTENMPESQAEQVFLMLQAYLKVLDETKDDAFCLAIDDAFEANPNKGELIGFDDACKMLGVNL